MIHHDASHSHELNYINEFTVRPQLRFILHLEKQLEAIRSVKTEDRIAFIDATGGLVNIPIYKGWKYQRILNYLILMKVKYYQFLILFTSQIKLCLLGFKKVF